MSAHRPPDWAPLEAQQLYWEKVLASEGMPPEPRPKQMRGARGTPFRHRSWRREFPVAPEGHPDSRDEDGERVESRRWVEGRAIYTNTVPLMEALVQGHPHDPLPSTEEDMAPLAAALDRALEALDPQDKEIFIAHAVEGVGYRTIAVRHGMAAHTTARDRVVRIRAQLVELLKGEVDGYLR